MSKKDSNNKLYINNIVEKSGVYSAQNTNKGLSTLQLPVDEESKMIYFEVNILKSNKGTPGLSIGFQPGNVDWKTKGQVGQHNGGCGWMSDSGGIHNDNTTVNPTIDKFKAGDIVGACWNTSREEIWFTKNGQKQKQFLGARSKSWVGQLYPTIVFNATNAVDFTVNCGEKSFSYDLSKEKDPDDVDDTKPLHEICVNHEDDVELSISPFFKKSENSDILLVVGTQSIPAHKIILAARSPYMMKQVFSLDKLVMESKFPDDINMLILEYIYTGKVLLTNSNWEVALKCADFYGVAGLRRACFDFMIKSLSKDTVLEVLYKAQNKLYDFEASDLIKRCVVFLEKNAHEVIKTKSFLELTDDVVAMILQNTNSVFDELDAFNACLEWGKYQQSAKKRTEDLATILKNITPHIRYPLLSPVELVKFVKPTKVAPIDLYAQAVEYHASPDLFTTIAKDNVQFTKRYKTFSGSSLLDEKMSQALLSFLPPSKKGWECIYKASRDGFDTTKFHAMCDNKGETFCVIQSDSNNIFGGYTPLPWQSNNAYTYDTRSFLFSLVNKNGKAPTKIPNNGTSGKHSSYGAGGYGPTFGGGHDLYICNQSNVTKSSYTNLGHSYKLPKAVYGQNDAKNFLAGSYNFLTKEIEVFMKIE